MERERFKIYLYSNLVGGKGPERVIITSSDSISEAATFDENFSIKENDKISMTFSIYDKLSNGELNPFIEYLVPEAVLGLELPDREKNSASPTQEGAFYKLKILERSPVFNEENILYNITLSDYASAVYSKQAEGLSIEKTGSLREIAEEILGETRKNTLYKDLNTNYAKIYTEEGWINHLSSLGIKYSLPYINLKEFSLEMLKHNPVAKFYVTDKFEHGEKYEIQFDVVASRATIAASYEPIDFNIGVVGKDLNGNETFNNVKGRVVNFDKSVAVRSEFTYSKGDSSPTDSIELQLHEITNLALGNPWPEFGTFEISIANIKITKSRSRTESRGDSTALFINHLENFTQFQSPEKGKNIDIKMTFSISNSNLYSSLISLATLFEAEVKFDYLENSIYFVSKKFRRYKGYRLDPRVNLKSISRPENSSDFATILHVEGSGDVDGIVPTVPKEWRRFLSECSDNNFSNDEFFKEFREDNTFKDYVEIVVESYMDKDDSEAERIYEINKFAEHMDKMPNFESTLYDFSYFEKIGLLNDKYPELINLINNTVRRLNISLNVNTYRYYTIYSEFATQLQQIAFYTNLINTEEKFKFNTEMKLLSVDAPREFTSSWVAYKNAIDAASANIVNYTDELYTLVGLNGNPTAAGSFAYNACMLFGYKDGEENGIQHLITENQEKIKDKSSERRKIVEKITLLEEELEKPENTQFIKDSISVELAGLRSQVESISNYIGRDEVNATSYRGSYIIENSLYQKLKEAVRGTGINIPQSLIDNNTSLFKLLFDRESPSNLVVKKEKELEALMDQYEPFALEARYQNSDEVTAGGLLEQGLSAFVKFNRPKVSYNISAIHIGALEDYSFLEHPEVGDKIKINQDLYLSYEEEETDYLVVVGYKERLRDPGSLELEVEKDDESELLVRRMLQQTNFIQMNKGRAASNRSVPVPRELEDKIPSIEESLNSLYETDLSIVGLFNEMVKK